MQQHGEQADIAELDRRHHLHPFTDARDLSPPGLGPRIVVSGKGCEVETADGQVLLDGMAGLWCVHIGYGREEMADAIGEQAGRLHFFNSFFGNSPDVTSRLSARLAEITPIDVNTFFFTSSGSEANDTIYKFSRLYWSLMGRPEKRLFITRRHSYHGVSGISTSLSGLDMLHPQWGYPLPQLNSIIRGPYQFQDGRGLDPHAYGLACARALEERILELGPENVGGFMAEPVYGAGGVIPPPPGYWAEVQRICRKHDVLLCADEVVCGFGRTGEWFGSQLYGIEPDFMTLAKGLTSGYVPMGAVGLSDRVADVIRDRAGFVMHGFTYSGHPVAAAAALMNIEIIEREGLVQRVRDDVGPYLQERFATLAEGAEERLVEQFVPQAAVEALVEAVLLGLAGRDVVPADVPIVGPGQDGVRRQLRAVVAHDGIGAAAELHQAVEFSSDAQPGDRGVRHQRQALARAVIHDCQDAEAPPVGHLVGDEVQAPALVRQDGRLQGTACPHRPLAPAAPPYGQLLLPIEPLHALPVHDVALPAEQNVQPPIAEPAPLGR